MVKSLAQSLKETSPCAKMLYNLVEACIVSGMMEIYEDLKNDNCSYNQVIREIQDIWSKYKI